MTFQVDLSAVFNFVVVEYDRISPALLTAEFERLSGMYLFRAKTPTPKEIITLEALLSFNSTGEPKLNLSGQEQHSLITPVCVVRNLLEACTFPHSEILSERIRGFVDYKQTSVGGLGNALTYYLSAKAIQHVGTLTGEGSGNVDLSPLENALGIAPK